MNKWCYRSDSGSKRTKNMSRLASTTEHSHFLKWDALLRFYLIHVIKTTVIYSVSLLKNKGVERIPGVCSIMIKSSRYRITRGTGHCVSSEAPFAFNNTLLRSLFYSNSEIPDSYKMASSVIYLVALQKFLWNFTWGETLEQNSLLVPWQLKTQDLCARQRPEMADPTR